MDQTQDQNPVGLFKVDALVGTPEFVLDSPVLTQDDCAKYASTGFADPVSRKFPIFNKAATWTSYAYLRGSGLNKPAVEARIKKASEVFGIAEEIKKIDQAFQSTTKSASAESAYALPAGSIPEMPDANVYPIKSAFDIENSARALVNDRNSIPVPLFYQAATAIAKAAAQKNVQISEVVRRAGELFYPDFEHAEKIAHMRRIVVKDATALDLYSQAVKSAKAENAIDVTPYLNVWFELDRAHGVKYAKGILDPYAAFYAGPSVDSVEKAASEHVFILNAPVPSAVIGKIDDQSFVENFNKQAAAKLQAWKKVATQDGVKATAMIAEFSEDTQKQVLRLALAVG